MEGWKEISLNEMGWFKGAGVNKLINSDEQSVYLVNYMDVYKNWQIYYKTDYQEVTAKDREIEEANLLEGDILFTPSSEKPIDIGHAGVVMENMPNCVYSYHLIRFRINDNKLFDLRFLSYLLNYDDVQKHFVSRASGSGIRYTLSLNDFKSVRISYPSLPEQNRISTLLTQVDEAILSVKRSISVAERLKKSLMQNLLTGRMKPDGTMRSENEFYIDEKFGKVPEGWVVKKLGDVCLNTGDYGANASAIPYDETKPRFIRITDIDDYGHLINDGKVSMDSNNYQKYLLKEDDLLFARTGDTVGKSFLYKENMGIAVFAGYLIRFSFNRNMIFPDFFNLIAKSYYFEAFKSSMKRVGAQPNINSREYCSFRFLMPLQIDEQKAIYNKFAHIEKEQSEKHSKITTLERLKKSLMQNLLTGKVRVGE